jgi:hypothetical protein
VIKEIDGSIRVSDRGDESGTEFEVTLGGVVPQPTASPSAVSTQSLSS